MPCSIVGHTVTPGCPGIELHRYHHNQNQYHQPQWCWSVTIIIILVISTMNKKNLALMFAPLWRRLAATSTPLPRAKNPDTYVFVTKLVHSSSFFLHHHHRLQRTQTPMSLSQNLTILPHSFFHIIITVPKIIIIPTLCRGVSVRLLTMSGWMPACN